MSRYATRLGVAALAIALAAAGAGCANSRSILYKGDVTSSGSRLVISDAAALRAGSAARSRWLADIARAGRDRPKPRFHNLSASQFRARLARAAARYRFTIKAVEFLHPRQLAPLVIVQTRHYLAMAHAARAILESIDPLRRHVRPRETFEALFFEAQDERGVPFIITSSDVRERLGGGQWARSEELYPFAHG
jgi:hypothetical protein